MQNIRYERMVAVSRQDVLRVIGDDGPLLLSPEQLVLLRPGEGRMVMEFPDGRSYPVSDRLADEFTDNDGRLTVSSYYSPGAEFYAVEGRSSLANYLSFRRATEILSFQARRRAAELRATADTLIDAAERLYPEMPVRAEWVSEGRSDEVAADLVARYPVGTVMVMSRSSNDYGFSEPLWRWDEDKVTAFVKLKGRTVVAHGMNSSGGQILVEGGRNDRDWVWAYRLGTKDHGTCSEAEFRASVAAARAEHVRALQAERARIDAALAASGQVAA